MVFELTLFLPSSPTRAFRSQREPRTLSELRVDDPLVLVLSVEVLPQDEINTSETKREMALHSIADAFGYCRS